MLSRRRAGFAPANYTVSYLAPRGESTKLFRATRKLGKGRQVVVSRHIRGSGWRIPSVFANRKLSIHTSGDVGLHGPSPVEARPTGRDLICTSGGLLATNLPLLPRRLQLPVALRVDLLLPPRQHVLRRDVARGAVQPEVVVVVHVSAHQTPCIMPFFVYVEQRQREEAAVSSG
jgi:hypothetical protein